MPPSLAEDRSPIPQQAELVFWTGSHLRAFNFYLISGETAIEKNRGEGGGGVGEQAKSIMLILRRFRVTFLTTFFILINKLLRKMKEKRPGRRYRSCQEKEREKSGRGYRSCHVLCG
jgi:hypothetical protein